MAFWIITVVVLGAVVAAFFSPAAAWGILILPVCFVLLMAASVKGQKWKNVPELSSTANALLQRHGHFYAMPHASRNFSSASSGIQFAAAAIAIIGAVRGTWWGILLAAVLWFVMAAVARKLNPTVFLEDPAADPAERAAHNEIIEFISSEQKHGDS